MAGYMTILQGYVYEGRMPNGAAAGVPNGRLMVRGTATDAGKFVLPAADTTTVLECTEAGFIYDGFDADTRTAVPAYRFVVKSLAAPYYFTEWLDIPDETMVYDRTKAECPVGTLMRNHPLLVGEEFVTTEVTGTIAVGTTYGVKADGTIG